jgi:hypothetical protein
MTNKHTRENKHNKILLTRKTGIPETIDTTRYYSQDKQAYQRQYTTRYYSQDKQAYQKQ